MDCYANIANNDRNGLQPFIVIMSHRSHLHHRTLLPTPSSPICGSSVCQHAYNAALILSFKNLLALGTVGM